MNLTERIEIFSKFSDFILENTVKKDNENSNNILLNAITEASLKNPWFSEDNIKQALISIANSTTNEKINRWVKKYQNIESKSPPVKVGIVMAGNIPLVGFMDFFYVIMSGNKALIKLSSDDNILIPALIEVLKNINPKITHFIEIIKDKLSGFEAVIATGSNNTSRYFEYYFGKYPNIIRKNRNSIAVLNGNETFEQLSELSNDITDYYGLGCRNVSKIFVPVSYNFDLLTKALKQKNNILDFHKYRNNYDYQKSILIINRTPFIDCESVLLTRNLSLSSPIAVVYYDFYDKIDEIINYTKNNANEIQCIVSNFLNTENVVPFGKTQSPELADYADNVDVMNFLLNL